MPRAATVNGVAVPMPAASTSPPFPSAVRPPSWYTVPNLNAPVMDPQNGTMGLPWNNFLYFNAARAALIDQLSGEVTTIQGQIITLQNQVGTLQGQVSTLQGQVATLQGQVATANNNIATLQTQMGTLLNTTIPNLQAEDANLQNQINAINGANYQGQINAIIDRLNRAGIPP